MSKTTLIIGCGNKYKNHYEIHDKNSFTIDENKRLEPDFVCVFGKDTLENNIKNKTFSKIIFEGLYPIAINTLLGVNELKRISIDSVNIQVIIIINNEIIILSERKNLISKYISSFLLFQMTCESECVIGML